ncbi:YybH family protein [Lysobacter enzymogenes]|uniref:YybH family protein n=1 Tax=Lysobacter enzymogenes TaxID=69 RepID=UPI0008984C07|nr:SgcJ/EcaC family oxidoreductase [Lysobacter enzymogenes]SDX36417.1 conserved hypothetical protein [Lysobacter enzymogenes]
MNAFSFRSTLAALALAAALPTSGHAAKPAPDASVKAAVAAQLDRYQNALNASDVDSIMKLYADDAVFMPQGHLPVEGHEAVRAAYRGIFDAIKLDVRFAIDEIRPLSKDWAYARTRSNGTVRPRGAAAPANAEANQELFLLQRGGDGQWRFARYIFSTTTPAKQP